MAETKGASPQGEEKSLAVDGGARARARARNDIQLEKVAPPNKNEHEANLLKLENGVKAVQQKIVVTTKSLEDKAAQRTVLRDQIKDIVTKLKSLKDQKIALQAERENLQNEIKTRDEARTDRMQKTTDLRKTLRYASIEEIDKAIAAIEFRLSTTTVSLKTEKDLNNEIKELKASKDQVRSFQESKLAIEDPALSTKDLRVARDEKAAALRQLREYESQHQTVLRDLRASENTVNNDIKTLISERRIAQNDMRALKDQLVLQRRDYEKAERAYKRYIDQVAYLKRQQRRQEREAREAEYRKRKAEEAADFGPQHPYEIEMYICEELARYLKRLAPKEVETEESKGESDKTASDRNQQFKGKDAVPLSKKDDEDIFGVPLSKSSKPTGKRRTRGRKGNVLTHIPDVFKQFEQIGLVPPLDVDSIPQSLKSLSDKLEFYRTAPPPLSEKEKSDHKRKLEKEKQEKIVSRDLRREEAKERSQLQQQARQMEQEEQWRRLNEYNAVIDEDDAEREQAYATAVTLEEQERQTRLREEQDIAYESELNRLEARNKAIALEEAERARRLAEEQEEEVMEQKVRESRRKKSIALMEEEQQRRIQEMLQTEAEERHREEQEREDAIALTIQQEEAERIRRLEEEEQRLKDEELAEIEGRKANLARLALQEEEERKRQIEDEEQDIIRSQKEEVVERQRRLSLAIQLEDQEQLRRIAELEDEQKKEEQEWLDTAKKVAQDIEIERRRQVKEFPDHIRQTSPFVSLLAQHPIKPADGK